MRIYFPDLNREAQDRIRKEVKEQILDEMTKEELRDISLTKDSFSIEENWRNRLSEEIDRRINCGNYGVEVSFAQEMQRIRKKACVFEDVSEEEVD